MTPLTMTQLQEDCFAREAEKGGNYDCDALLSEIYATRAALAEAEAQRNEWREAALDYPAVSVKLQASEARCAALVEAVAWIASDASYKAPECMCSTCDRWLARVLTALAAAQGTKATTHPNAGESDAR